MKNEIFLDIVMRDVPIYESFTRDESLPFVLRDKAYHVEKALGEFIEEITKWELFKKDYTDEDDVTLGENV